MRTKSLAAAVVIALAITAPAAPAFAAAHPHGKSANHNAKGLSHKPVKTTFVLAGTLTAVDLGAGTLTFTAHGGPDKALRGKPLTVTVPTTAKIVRNDAAATLAVLVAGDHLNVKGVKANGTYTATRVAAQAPEPVAPTT